jgi:propionate CoA-transferase
MRKVIGRRAVMELRRNSVLNVGTGIPNDVIGPILIEEDVSNDVTLTVESGIYGGFPAGGVDFGISKNAVALITHHEQFDYYNGAGVDFTFMGAGEMDKNGRVNATRMGDKAPGAGGFIDITSMAKHVIFCSGFTGKGLEVGFEGGRLNILQEGNLKKLVKKVQQISFDGSLAAKQGQKVWFVTERAVFYIDEEGPVLIEIAKGIDIEKDIFAEMEFMPRVAKHLGEIPPVIYSSGTFGLKSMMCD